jgi:hypothetical protein
MTNCSIYHMLHGEVGCVGDDASVECIVYDTGKVKINVLTHVNLSWSPVMLL